MNVAVLSGRITHDPELKQTPGGKSVCSFSLAVDRPKVKDVTDFFNFVAWDKIAEYIANYAHKGDTIEVSGVITTRSFEDRQGVKKTVTEIKVESCHVIRKVGAAPVENAPVEAFNNAPNVAQWEEQGGEDDLPF